MLLFAQVVLPDGSVAVIISVVATLWSALVWLWRSDLKRSEQIATQQRERIRELERLLMQERRDRGHTRRRDDHSDDQADDDAAV